MRTGRIHSGLNQQNSGGGGFGSNQSLMTPVVSPPTADPVPMNEERGNVPDPVPPEQTGYTKDQFKRMIRYYVDQRLEYLDEKSEQKDFKKEVASSWASFKKARKDQGLDWETEACDELFYSYFPVLAPMEPIAPRPIDMSLLRQDFPLPELIPISFEIEWEDLYPPNEVGDRIVENYNACSYDEQRPGTKCFAAAKKRVSEAWMQVRNESLTAELPDTQISGFDSNEMFNVIWNLNRSHSKWMEIDPQYRGTGSAGAMVWAGKGDFVTQEEIWDGDLRPGAVIQVWADYADFERVRNGESAQNIGHSFIFIEYIIDGDEIRMRIADQGTGWDAEYGISESTFGYWIGANIR